jgi:hypothetical protein
MNANRARIARHRERIARPARGLLAAIVLVALAAAVLAAAGPPARAADPTPSSSAASPWYHLDAAGAPVVDLWFGWSSTCPHCTSARAWLDEFAPGAAWLEVHSLRVDGTDAAANIETLSDLAATIDEQIRGVPVFLYAGRLDVGFEAAATTGARLEAELREYHESLATAAEPSSSPSPGPSTPGESCTIDEACEIDETTAITLPFVGPLNARELSLPLLAVVLGGLDAVNPCALSVLLFLVSALVGANARRRILLVGGAFVVATGVVYFLLMAAWLNAFLLFGELRVVTLVAGAAALGAGLINVKDFGWFRRGPSLVIPAAARPSIFGRILDLSETIALPALVGTAILVAATAAAYEMLCTGGFPVVFTRVLTLSELPTVAYYAYLGLYVAVYVLPMVAIVAAVAITLGTHSISIDEARRLKLLSGLLMVGVGGLLLIAPDRLSDLSWTLGLFIGAGILWFGLVLNDRTRRSRSLRSPAAPRASPGSGGGPPAS